MLLSRELSFQVEDPLLQLHEVVGEHQGRGGLGPLPGELLDDLAELRSRTEMAANLEKSSASICPYREGLDYFHGRAYKPTGIEKWLTPVSDDADKIMEADVVD